MSDWKKQTLEQLAISLVLTVLLTGFAIRMAYKGRCK